MQIRDKVVLITGASGGIGLATARRFARNSLGNRTMRHQQRQSPAPTDSAEFVAEKILAAAVNEPEEQYMDS